MPSADKEEVEELSSPGAESTHLQTTGTSDGTSLLRRILGNTTFPFPKPLPLVQALIAQCTDRDDLVLDFFAGSGTTGHAVLAQNEEDAGERRFILVSSTEATVEDPDKNVCRDVCQRRIAKVIQGYTYPTKTGPKDVPGLGTNCAYLRTRRIPPALLLEIEHAEVWTAVQLAHSLPLASFQDAPFLWAGDEESAVCYVPRFRRDLLAALRRKATQTASVALYSWQPQTLRQHIRDSHVAHLSVSETLTRRFGLNLTLAPA